MTTTTTTQDPRTIRPATGSPSIVARGLTKRFGDVTAVQDLSFEVRPGKVTGFLGPNGAGKSTTLRILLGLVRPTDGDATILGMPYGSLDRPIRTVGAVLETATFHPLRRGRDHLRVLAATSRIPVARIDEVLEQVGLSGAAGRKVGKYSLGMRQRLGLAAALLGNPSVLILDEPANGLDPQGIRWLRELLQGFASRGNSVLVSSHLLSEMAQMADDIIVIHRGRLVRQGTVDELTGGGSVLRVASPQADRLAAALEAEGMVVHQDGDERLTVRGTTADRVGTLAFAAGIPLLELASERSTLEDAFLDMTNEEEVSR
ncbi:MAG: ABC transporter ATP-binding protein [Actinomycetota bacterium]|nr:ABC transporter ATP-binding protein [Actinomycetota bacterium]